MSNLFFKEKEGGRKSPYHTPIERGEKSGRKIKLGHEVYS
jgi:hypothetical protein